MQKRKSFPEHQFLVYNAEIFLWTPTTHEPEWLRELSSIQKKCKNGTPLWSTLNCGVQVFPRPALPSWCSFVRLEPLSNTFVTCIALRLAPKNCCFFATSTLTPFREKSKSTNILNFCYQRNCQCFGKCLFPNQTWNLSKNLQDRRFRGKKFTQKTRNFRHLLNRDKKCIIALNWDKTGKKCSLTM